MAENLKTTRYNDGTPIPNITIQIDWAALKTPGYCWYNNDKETYKNTYGALYNWFAVNTGILCPTGWHVPTDAEWHQLILFLDPKAELSFTESNNAGGSLKETGTAHWLSPNIGATNKTGFTALPSVYRNNEGYFPDNITGQNSYWWSATEYTWPFAIYRYMYFFSSAVERNWGFKQYGFSVRCVKD